MKEYRSQAAAKLRAVFERRSPADAERNRAIDRAVESAAQCDRLTKINTDLVEALECALPLLEVAQREADYEVGPLTKARAAITRAKDAMK